MELTKAEERAFMNKVRRDMAAKISGWRQMTTREWGVVDDFYHMFWLDSVNLDRTYVHALKKYVAEDFGYMWT